MNTTTDSEKRKLYIALSYCSFLKGSERLLLARTLDTLQALTVSSIDTLSRIVQRSFRTRSYKPELLEQAVEKAESLMKYCRINMTFYDDADFPPLLREIPMRLFAVLPRRFAESGYARCGDCRYPPPDRNGIKAALQLGTECGHAGIPVISGLARESTPSRIGEHWKAAGLRRQCWPAGLTGCTRRAMRGLQAESSKRAAVSSANMRPENRPRVPLPAA